LEALKAKQSSEENKEKEFVVGIARLQEKHKETFEKLGLCQKSKGEIKQKMNEASNSVANKTVEVNKLDMQKEQLGSRQLRIDNDLQYYDRSIQVVNQDKGAIREVYNDVDLHHQIYSNLQTEMLKGLELRNDYIKNNNNSNNLCMSYIEFD